MFRFLLVLLFAASAYPQVFDATRIGAPVVIPPTAPWRFHDEPVGQNGTELGWASPKFDDSSWAQGDGGTPGLPVIRWYRLKVELPARNPGESPLVLLVALLSGAYEVYADGQRIGGLGSIASHARIDSYLPLQTLSALPQTKSTVQIALRVWMGTPYAGGIRTFIPGLPNSLFVIGEQSIVHAIVRTQNLDPNSLSQSGKSVLSAAIALMLFLVWRRAPGLKSNLWLAWSLVGHCLFYLMGTLFLSGRMSENLALIFRPTVGYFILITEIEFLFAYFNLRVHILGRWLQYLLVALAVLTPLLPARLGILLDQVAQPASLFLMATCWVCLIYYRGASGHPEARILLLPAAFRFVARILFFLTNLSDGALSLYSKVALNLDPIFLDADDVATYCYYLSIGAVLIRRFLITERMSIRTAGELEAAREAQAQLVPSAPPSPPGFRLEAAYLPASEVGGDFYQVLPLADGRWLIVLGDVSGKGLKAAMSGAALIGALRILSSTDQRPASILSYLNQMLCQNPSGGFTTCLCLIVAQDGGIVYANAGHLPAYLAGNEIVVPGSLPLGLDPAAEFDPMQFQMAPGQCLTLISDGVIEAENVQRELFGFDRTRAISAQSAQDIANAAKAWGQTDDITVVTLRRLN